MDEFKLVTILAGLFLLGCGYLIKVKKKMNLIAGYSAAAVADEDGLAAWVGSNVIFIAVVVLLSALFHQLFRSIPLPLAAACAVVILTDVAVTLRGCGKYMHGSPESAARAKEARDLKPVATGFLDPTSALADTESLSVDSFERRDEAFDPARRIRIGS